MLVGVVAIQAATFTIFLFEWLSPAGFDMKVNTGLAFVLSSNRRSRAGGYEQVISSELALALALGRRAVAPQLQSTEYRVQSPTLVSAAHNSNKKQQQQLEQAVARRSPLL